MKKSMILLAVAVMNVLPPLAHAVEKPERDLLVVANMVTNGDPKFIWLYQFLNLSAVSIPQTALGLSYRKIHVLSGSAATKQAFTSSIASISGLSAVKALDVIVALHGSDETLHFQDGPRSMGAIQTALGNGSNTKLRMLYSTACFGASHANNFVAGGFRVASGSRGVNANAGFEYPMVLGRWALGQTFSEAITAGNDPGQRAIADAGARLMGFTNVDSFKVISGTSSTRISTNAQ